MNDEQQPMNDKAYHFQRSHESVLSYYQETNVENGWMYWTEAGSRRVNTGLANILEVIGERHMWKTAVASKITAARISVI